MRYAVIVIIKIMLVKHLLSRSLYARQLCAFGSSKPPYGPDITDVSKHNPDAEKRLRGNEGMESLEDIQKSISPIHLTTYKKSSAYHFCSLFR